MEVLQSCAGLHRVVQACVGHVLFWTALHGHPASFFHWEALPNMFGKAVSGQSGRCQKPDDGADMTSYTLHLSCLRLLKHSRPPFFCVTIYSSSYTMPPATADDSSAISESRRINVTSHDGGLCVLCGMDPVDVGHFIAGKSGDQGQVSETGRLV